MYNILISFFFIKKNRARGKLNFSLVIFFVFDNMISTLTVSYYYITYIYIYIYAYIISYIISNIYIYDVYGYISYIFLILVSNFNINISIYYIILNRNLNEFLYCDSKFFQRRLICFFCSFKTIFFVDLFLFF